VRSLWLVPLLSAAAGCGEGPGTPGPHHPLASRVDPSLEVATAPRVDRSPGPPSPQLAIAYEAPAAEHVPGPGAPLGTGLLGPLPLDSASVGHLEGPERLVRVFEALAALDEGRGHEDVRILQYGDSHTASDAGTGVLRRLLQARFGDGGRGFVSIGKPWKTYTQDGVRGGMTKDFEIEKVKFKDGQFSGDGCYGLLGVGVGTSKGGARAWTEVAPRSSRVEIAYWQEPRGGSVDVFIDGTRAGRIAARAAQPGSGFFAFDVADAPHEVELRTVGDGEVRVFGMALDRAQAGVVVDALGINGAQIFTPLRWKEDHFAEQLRHRAPDLVVVAYGSNEALEPGLTDAEYERGLVDMLGRIARAAPTASCLLLGPPDLARRAGDDHVWATWPRLLEIVAAERRVAQAAGCAFYDQLEAMGGPGSIIAWASESEPRAAHDRIHLTRTGYAQLATAFASDILHAYDSWRMERGLAPTGAARTWGMAQR
jgi:lysophospholipase L1-like esterase